MPYKTEDDVIRIRIDTSRAVREFLDLLATQAAEGETRAPAKPRATAVFRELAPYRLVEYAYVGGGVGEVQGAYVGLPCGTIYSVADEIPEDAIDALVEGDVAALPPIYVFVLLEEPAPGGAIDQFLTLLADHVGLPLVGVYRDEGAMVARAYGALGQEGDFDRAARIALSETSLHLDKAQILDRFVARSESPDGRAFARLSYGFVRHMLVFPSAAERDDFVMWSRLLCDWVNDKLASWEDLGFAEVFRAAEPAPAPEEGVVLTAPESPRQFKEGRPWTARAGDSFGSGPEVMSAAEEYWRYVKDMIDGNESGYPRIDGWVIRE